MPLRPPFHAASGATFHDNTECVLAEEIPLADREDGDGGKKRCPLCESLNRAEQLARP